MLKKILLTFLLLITALVIKTLVQPTNYTIKSTRLIEVPKEKIFTKVRDLRHWAKWSPWYERDPKMTMKFSSISDQIGSRQDWESEKEGTGYRVLTQIKPYKMIGSDLFFIAPWEGHAKVEFRFEPKAKGTQVSWIIHSKNKNFIEKFFYWIMVEGDIKRDFEKGLANLERLTAQ